MEEHIKNLCLVKRSNLVVDSCIGESLVNLTMGLVNGSSTHNIVVRRFLLLGCLLVNGNKYDLCLVEAFIITVSIEILAVLCALDSHYIEIALHIRQHFLSDALLCLGERESINDIDFGYFLYRTVLDIALVAHGTFEKCCYFNFHICYIFISVIY
uniref:Uncharacterized protein n=1 Tax=Podoviridae sp. ctn7K25 TaxID=2825273 RepID=A0A8S5QCX4_9CAUD|nr:MAG TPA: hypothetical protein [Podoviridae sp. ctn7K25]